MSLVPRLSASGSRDACSLFRRKLKSACDHATHGKVLIQGFPPQCGSAEFQGHFFQFLIRRSVQAPKAVCGKPKNPPIVELKKNHSPFEPHP